MPLFDVYPLFNIKPVNGEGSFVYDDHGKKYLDFYGGHAVISVGHAHPYYVSKLKHQLEQIAFYSNSVLIDLQQELAEKLGRLSGYPDHQLFLCNSGAEAVENALKMASFHNGKKEFIAFNKAFHGRTGGALQVTDNPKIRSPFNETDRVHFYELEDIQGVEERLQTGVISGVIIEGIQGVAGIIEPSLDFLQALRSLCNKYEACLILDEVQSGYGRTGKFSAHQHAGIQADLITLAKGMGNGFPIGGVLIGPQFKASYGLLGTTFGGNHLACAAGIAVLDLIEKEDMINNAKEVGSYLISQLAQLPQVEKITGKGLMIGLTMKEGGKELRNQLLFKHQIFTGGAGNPNILRFLPPLNVTKDECNILLQALTAELTSEATL